MTTFRTPPGTPAPDFRAPSSNGQTLDQESFLGKVPLLLVFPGNDRGRAEEILIAFDAQLLDFGHRRVQVLGIVNDTARSVRELAERLPLPSLTLLADGDGSIANSYGVDGDPWYVLVDREGLVFRSFAHDPQGDYVEHALTTCDALVGPPVLP